MHPDQLRQIARNYRTANARRGGYITITERVATGWIPDLATPEQFKPEIVFAVGPDGDIHQTAGGDDQRGADRWKMTHNSR
ncbi:MAG: hypothetical protein AAGI48_03960 [Verrucomicrobiota bacterium]